MTGAEVQATYFTPFHYFAYLFFMMVAMTLYYQWAWTRKCERCVKVIVSETDGSSNTLYAPKEGNYVCITNPDTKTSRLWPLSEVSTIEMLYPGDGFVPQFLQKKIRTTIVDKSDWEPLLNRGAYSTQVASPDVKALLTELAENTKDDKTRERLQLMVANLRTASTREMIGSPAILGNIAKEKVSELAVTVAKDIMNPLQEALKKLGQQLNPTIVYIMLGLAVLLAGYSVFKVSQIDVGKTTDVSGIANDIAKIKTALGVKQ